MRADTAAVVLAGGLARRMGGGDKPLREIAGRTMLDRVLERLRPQAAPLAINANGDPARFAAWGLPVLPDPMEGFPGPLAGILAAMDWAAGQGLDWVVTMPGDTPFLPVDLVARLHAAREAAATPLACAASAGHTHPPCGLWNTALREALRSAMAGGERKIDRWTALHGVAHAEWQAAPLDPFFNANTLEELAEAEMLLHKTSASP
ncbi:molybdenum cofactor guanylyltransferase MobA [Rhodovarius crocodyli]|uniref:Molybdenum cofactor guanylyltransferase n=1 Tax=Rhodovarius crocodyli TaxID=1979269 RepID=A0A437MM45_9PROT|nr:molybdenum cofactor guanylyltransferase MobA [Rhodovarius crocodyli]RVT98705.1 molybdenum cofactor guanylyltransferase MobA [Rhodovarius crocodyli]